MSEESSSAKPSSEPESPNRSEQVADIILKAIVAGGGLMFSANKVLC